MNRVFKYLLRIEDDILVKMPRGATLLTVAMQRDEACLWALVDPDAPVVYRLIQVRGTGHDASEIGPYIATFQMHGGSLVFHAFDGGEVTA